MLLQEIIIDKERVLVEDTCIIISFLNIYNILQQYDINTKKSNLFLVILLTQMVYINLIKTLISK